MIQYFNQIDGRRSQIPDYNYCPYCGLELTKASRNLCTKCGFIEYKNPLPGVSILISDSVGRILLGKRKNEQDLWCLPCGFIEINENFLIAAHREVKEETGLDIQIDSIVNVVSNIISPKLETLVIVLHGKASGGTMKPGDDLVDLKWNDASSIPKLAFAADEFIIQKYLHGNLKKIAVDSRFSIQNNTLIS